MSTAEIESAIGQLSAQEMDELAARLDEYHQSIPASTGIFSLYDEEEKAG